HPYLLFFCTTPYTTEIYPLSLHDALPIYTNTYGLRPFLPWNPTWYYGDLLPIIDPYLDAVLFTGILAGEVSRHNKRFITWLCLGDRKSTRLNSSHLGISYAVFCLKKKKKK